MQQKIRAILFSFLICICPLTFSGCSNAPAAPADSLISSSSEAETATTQPDTNSHDAFEKFIAELSDENCNIKIASGGGRMVITMDRYEDRKSVV